MLTKPNNTRAYIAHTPRDDVVAVYYINPPKLAPYERTYRDLMRNRFAKALNKKHGIAYRAALKWVTQLALPRIEGTLKLRHSLDLLERAELAAGMAC